ncbi:hypothetical protein CIPAW_06G175500 [Carya illinoinensis]|uniref:Uncharacterized protein n=1 Tax=Carya illinoinensis TaxID=32201 RepID=A0A8T1QD46_CARIL|nr:hypothetical protein CIPAW_06G175500 [Carya illinoinensis]
MVFLETKQRVNSRDSVEVVFLHLVVSSSASELDLHVPGF